ncbi:patellin-3 [Ricinus communis]|uniref:Patellin-3, putative n=1 Tax=Ricinus communis TaxID=3988 RepID=B9SHD9_RICCO|nr:patellin-3 [Ricinus communis]EEF36972.1 Patellin-3, putative [Ricinus communis]|eukprot:XP_002525405.1 patellin-3 [Ricinus communis]
MAEEVQKGAQEELARQVEEEEEEVVVVADVPQAGKMTPTPAPPPPSIQVVEKEAPPVPETEEEPLKPKQAEQAVQTEVLKPSGGNDEKIPEPLSFKEESTKVADLLDSEKKAVEELRQLVQEALNKHEFTNVNPSVAPAKEEKEEAAKAQEEQKPAQEEPAPEEKLKAEDKVVVEAEETKDEVEKNEKIETVQTDVSEENKVVHPCDAMDDDGAKTVEAIEETIVAVSSSAPQEQTLPLVAKEPEAKETVSSTVEEEAKDVIQVPPEEVSIWGIPLLADERSDVILLKFLRARDFKVRDAFTMLKNTIRWRKEFGIDELLEEDLGDDLGKAVFMHGFDKERHPVCYNVYGEFQDKELYQKCFSDEEKRNRFLKWRIQFLERSIRKLEFTPGGISTIVQVNDLKNSPGPTKRELRQATKQALQLLQDNYPEFVAKQVFINVPWWYLAFNKMMSPFLTQRTRSKFVFAGPSKSAEILFRYIAAEQIPVKYGGLSKDGEFGTTDTVTEITIKPAGKHTVEFPVSEACLLTWEVRVVGWDVNYGAEFVPSAEQSYTVIIQKARKIGVTEEPVVCNSFKIGEPGKIVLTIDNPTSKKKKLLYRLKTKLSSD